MSDWKEYKLGEIADITSSKRIFFSDYVLSGIPFFRSKEIIEKAQGKTINTELFITSERYFNIKENFGAPLDGDILISAVGERAGIPYCVKNDGDFYFKDGNLIWFRNFKKEILSDFLVYFFKSAGGQQSLESVMIGSAQKALTIIGLKGLLIKFPSYQEQISIATILTNIDDKIDLLQRQNKTLEQVAETLFRQWFVEEANEIYVEKGLDEIAEFLNGLPCQKYPIRMGETGLPVIKIKELRTGITESSDVATCAVPEKYIVRDGEMLFSWSGSLDVVIWSGGQGVLNQHLFKVTSHEFPQWFYFFWVKHHLPEFQGIALDKATTMGHIQRHHLSNAKVLVPSKEDMDRMDETICPIFEKIKLNQKQIHTLGQLRDTLLPKLMSGEVRVKIKD